MGYQREVTAFAHSRGLATHLDGARVFNAIVKLNVDERTGVAGFDSVSICLSKGLGAPAGTMLVGSRDFIGAARRWRKALGGGMRQAGVLAAAGLYALQNHVRRLADDHANAEFLAAGLHAIGLSVVAPQTNILYVDIPVPKIPGLKAHLDGRGINVTVTPRTRLVTHLDVPHPKIATTLQAFREFDWAD
jgi:threonine aldolase